MANRRPQNPGRRMDYNRMDRNKTFNRSTGVSPWQGGGGPNPGMPNLLPLGGNSTEATLALANNLISNLLQNRQSSVPSLLDMPMRRDFMPDLGRFDRGYGQGGNRMGNQGNFRRTGTYNRNGERVNTIRKPFRSNDGPRKQHYQRKEDKPVAKPVIKQESAEPTSTEGEAPAEVPAEETNNENSDETPRKTKYDNISRDLLKCHICNKSMWDGRSFENHINGRAHAIMMQKASECYALTADTMRQEFKIREMKQNRKAGVSSRDFYCAMCDLYAADGASHRTSIGHRKLKKYLHPHCAVCRKEMPTRIELDEHRFTIEHLRNMMGRKDSTPRPRPELMILSTLSMEQSWVREGRRKRRRSETQDNNETENNAEDKGEASGEATGEAKEGQEENAEQEEVKEVIDTDTDVTIIDYKEGDDLANFNSQMLPAYSATRGVGRSFIQPYSCFECKLCHKLLDSAETVEVHINTWRHYQLFVKLLKNTAAEKNPPAEENGDCKRRKTTDDKYDPFDEDQDSQAKGDESEEAGNAVAEDDVKKQWEEGEGNGEEQGGEGEGENWEQTVDEILEDETGNGAVEEAPLDKTALDETLIEETPAEETPAEETPVEEPPVEEPPVEETPVESTPAKTPRAARGRGRGRRGRY